MLIVPNGNLTRTNIKKIYHLNYSLVFVFVVIIEFEVSNRSVPAIRRDFMSYFNNDAELHSVIAIKVFNTGEFVFSHLSIQQ